jgi:GNAT superfamily N-acetyltransferase
VLPSAKRRRRVAAAPAVNDAKAIRVRPVTTATWADFEALFTARGSPHYCWCAVYRFKGAHVMSSEEKRRMTRRLVEDGVPIGVLAYDAEVPVGWCSVAPRESFVKLERSRTMGRASSAPTWTVLCFFVRRTHRRAGVAQALLGGALTAARAGGARVVEGYPHDTAGISATHRGHSRLFRALGFRRDGARWAIELEGV